MSPLRCPLPCAGPGRLVSPVTHRCPDHPAPGGAPRRPAVLWDRVTLTCQGLRTAGATTWYKDGQRWGQNRHERFTVTENGTYQCDKHGSGLSSPVTVWVDSTPWVASHTLCGRCLSPALKNIPVHPYRLVLQVPALTLLEGEKVTLRCRAMDMSDTRVQFYQDEKNLGGSHMRTELSRSPLQLSHSGHYHCKGFNQSPNPGVPHGHQHTVGAVQELFTVPVLDGPPEPTEGSPLNLSCLSTPSPLWLRTPLLHLFYQDGMLVGGPRGFRSSWCLLWRSPTRGITAARCTPRGEPCGRAAPSSASRCAVSAGMGTGSPHSLFTSAALPGDSHYCQNSPSLSRVPHLFPGPSLGPPSLSEYPTVS
uniref:Ig-like domain-containing protein n=1 Tax=Zosterops lateralis melanops TaxID=1220523 RepID=A0A8D2PF45_ZOSLA